MELAGAYAWRHGPAVTPDRLYSSAAAGCCLQQLSLLFYAVASVQHARLAVVGSAHAEHCCQLRCHNLHENCGRNLRIRMCKFL